MMSEGTNNPDKANFILDNFKNDKQKEYNSTIGSISEFNDAESYCSLTLTVGVDGSRFVNFSVKKQQFDIIANTCEIGDKVKVYFYPTSKKAQLPGKYYTNNCIIDIEKINYNK